MDDVISKTIEWAENEPSIRAIILEGSRGSGGNVDEFSDFDLNVFIQEEKKFMLGDAWLNTFDHVLVYQNEKFNYQNIIIPTRLVFFEHLPRIDFSFWPLYLLEEMKEENLPESYKNGFQVLIDKDGLSRQLPRPSGGGFNLVRPDPDEFLETIYNFWFEMMVCTKYMQRGSLWFVKTIADCPARKYLLQMILWKEGCEQGWDHNDIHLNGKNLEMKVCEMTLRKIPSCFSTYRSGETKLGLLQMIDFFKILSSEVSAALNYPLPEGKLLKIEQSIHQYY